MDGRLVPAKELIGRYFAVPTYLQDGTQAPALAWATNNGTKPVYRLTTSSGRRIVRTGNHPLLAGMLRQYRGLKPQALGWVPVEQLLVGQVVAIPTQLHITGRRSRREDEIKLLGYLLGDGGTTVCIDFTQQDGPAKDEFCGVVERLGGKTTRSGELLVRVTGVNGTAFTSGCNPIINLAREWGVFGKKATEKHFPDWVWELPNEQLALLLNRLFACDGWAYCREPGARGHNQIGISLASERMVRDIELAMLRIGISGRVRRRTMRYAGKEFGAWEWAAYQADEILKFAERVNILGKEQAVSNCVATARVADRNKTAKWPFKEVPVGYRWDRIVAIEPLGERPTVTISVPGTHTFVTTVVEHNSFTAAHVALWFLYTHPNSIVITTAPTGRQVKRILWQEIRRAWTNAAAPLGGELLKQELQIDDKWYSFGFSSDEPTNFSGLHADWVLFIVDEATGIPKENWEAIDGVLSGEHTRLLAIGNPTDATSEFAARIKRGGEGTKVIPISAFDTPNFTEAGITETNVASGAWRAKLEAAGGIKYPYLVSPAWVAKIYDKYGPESAMYVSRVKAKFPAAGSDALIPLVWIERAQARWQDYTDKLAEGLTPVAGQEKVLGVDVAEFGSDSTVRTLRVGQYVAWQRVSSQEDTMITAGRVAADMREDPSIHANVDVVGIGNGVARRLEELFGERASGINVGERAEEPERFVNKKAELYWHLRTLFEQGGIMIPPDEDLTEELSAIKYKVVDSTGKIRITGKDDLRKPEQLGRSPDRADSLMLTVAKAPEQQEAFAVVG